MNILMMTNTYLPHVGGVANSVHAFAGALREAGHRVLVVAPEFEDGNEKHTGKEEDGVIRLPAIQRFNGSDFSVRLPIPGLLSAELARFQPDIVHAHHPFLLGDTALRVAARRDLPLVFTHHTLYERYTHYVPGDSPTIRRFAIRMATEYANLCDQVIAPSESIQALLEERGVTTPITPIPTGIDPVTFGSGDGTVLRKRLGIPPEAFVVGHVGRLAPEKNLGFLSRSLARFLVSHPDSHCLIAGTGSAEDEVRAALADPALASRVHFLGKRTGRDLVDAYAAMDLFAFASTSETQGMVLAEAMAAGVPVVALDAPGVREVVNNGQNGELLFDEEETVFADALDRYHAQTPEEKRAMQHRARQTAEAFSLERCTQRLIGVYRKAAGSSPAHSEQEDTAWSQTLRLLEMEWNLWSGRAEAAAKSLRNDF